MNFSKSLQYKSDIIPIVKFDLKFTHALFCLKGQVEVGDRHKFSYIKFDLKHCELREISGL